MRTWNISSFAAVVFGSILCTTLRGLHLLYAATVGHTRLACEAAKKGKMTIVSLCIEQRDSISFFDCPGSNGGNTDTVSTWYVVTRVTFFLTYR